MGQLLGARAGLSLVALPDGRACTPAEAGVREQQDARGGRVDPAKHERPRVRRRRRNDANVP